MDKWSRGQKTDDDDDDDDHDDHDAHGLISQRWHKQFVCVKKSVI